MVTKMKIFKEIHKSKDDPSFFSLIRKYNKNHDPKTGRFTYSTGGGGSSFTPAASVSDAVAYAKNNLGFKNVSYEYSYIDQERMRQVSGTLDIDTINHINGEITKIQEKYPETKGVVSNLSVDCGYATAATAVSGRNKNEVSLKFKPDEYSKGVDHVNNEWSKRVSKGEHPPGTDASSILWHEYGHVLALYEGKKAGAKDYYSAMKNSSIESEWVSKASSSLGMSEDSFLGSISVYGSNHPAEAWAEAFSEYNTSPNPRKECKTIVEVAGLSR